MTDSPTEGTRQQDGDAENLGGDKTIPNDPNGLAAGHDPDGSHFNPEEDTDPDADSE
ncbi:hypothetical protein [Herbiconiux flava]|uniref:Uncharacterized protein n=1 Tax=Herbiconiux flava TaxID=881268 RepID=A0A852SSS1_9MICO|nr:hypothetical protein [Herbiconiux flava]NYD72028.1 hypothetical protein [Herbiconiux flava]GLK18009.1 hypothetical protein GCM10017602_24910 [Herbiconiux flava]